MEEKIVIGLIDSGIDRNDIELKRKQIDTYYYNGESFESSSNFNGNEHGTNIAKILFREYSEFKIVSLSILDKKNKSKLEALISAIKFCIELKVDIINLSLGTYSKNRNALKKLYNICKLAIENDIKIVSSHNNLKNKNSYPASFNDIVSVTTDNELEKLCYTDMNTNTIKFSDSLLYVSKNKKYQICKGNSYLTPFIIGIYCNFLKNKKIRETSITKFANDFLGKHNFDKIFFNKKCNIEINSFLNKRVIFFTDTMCTDNVHIIDMYKKVCDLKIYFEDIDSKSLMIEENLDIFFIGRLTKEFVLSKKGFLTELIKKMLKKKVEIIMLFPVINVYDRYCLVEKYGGSIKSIYK